MYDEGNKATFGYLGMEIVERMVDELKLNGDNEIPKDVNKADDLYRSLGIFVGTYTFEVDMMENAANTERAAKAHKVLVDLWLTAIIGNVFPKLRVMASAREDSLRDLFRYVWKNIYPIMFAWQ